MRSLDVGVLPHGTILQTDGGPERACVCFHQQSSMWQSVSLIQWSERFGPFGVEDRVCPFLTSSRGLPCENEGRFASFLRLYSISSTPYWEGLTDSEVAEMQAISAPSVAAAGNPLCPHTDSCCERLQPEARLGKTDRVDPSQ